MNDLTAFEERRLAELKQIVAVRATARHRPVWARPALARPDAPRGHRRWSQAWTWATAPPRRHRIWAAALTTAVAVGAITLVASLGDTTKAYAVTKHANGTVDIYIREFNNAEALSRQLDRLGVPARVFNIDGLKLCRQPYARKVHDIPAGLYSHPLDVPHEPDAMRLQINTRLIKPGQYFVFALFTSVDTSGFTSRGAGEFLVTGRLVKCHYEPAPKPTIGPDAPKGAAVVGITAGDLVFADD